MPAHQFLTEIARPRPEPPLRGPTLKRCEQKLLLCFRREDPARCRNFKITSIFIVFAWIRTGDVARLDPRLAMIACRAFRTRF